MALSMLRYIGGVGFVDDKTPGLFHTLPEIWDKNLAVSRESKFLGHRPVISTSPLKFGPYVWQTYGEIDVRRRHLGSALYHMFRQGRIGGGELESVGVWSQNRPGKTYGNPTHKLRDFNSFEYRMANH
jgi:long-chain acyl-CoA synthetase